MKPLAVPRLISAQLSIVLAVLVALLLATDYVLSRQKKTSEQLNRAITRQYESLELAEQLRRSSDDLTRMVRSYVATGDPAFKEYFYAILGIREGKAPRSPRYGDVYWDFVITGDEPPPGAEAGERASLRSLMDRAGFSEEELQLLAEALRRSDRLVEFEEAAMNALEGRFRDKDGRLSVVGKPDRQRALQLLFGEEYHRVKSAMMRPIDDVLQRVRHRTSTALAAAQDEQATHRSALVFLFVALFLVLPLFILLAYRYHRVSSDEQARREERLRALAADLTLTEERERRRIATELHDGAVQALASARMRLDAAKQRAETSEQAETLDEVSQLLRRTALEVNRTASDLSSPSLSELGLVAAISEWMKEQVSQGSGIETELVDQLDETDHEGLDDVVGVILFRCVRELLTNVVQHAHATKIAIVLRRVGDSVELMVRNDGVGCNLAEACLDGGGGIGLFAIRERMTDLGGALKVDTAPNKGVSVTMVIPATPRTPAVEWTGSKRVW